MKVSSNKNIINVVFILILNLYVFSCKRDNNNYNTSLIGNWSVFDKDSTYFEVHIDSSLLIFYNYDAYFLPSRPYRIYNDSLYMRFSESGAKEISYLIKDFNDSTFKLKSKNNTLSFIKIDSLEFTFDKLLNFEKEKLKFELSHLNRKNKILNLKHQINIDSIIEEIKKSDSPVPASLD